MDFSLIHQFPYVGLFALLMLGAVGFPFPEDGVLILCGFMIQTNVVSPAPALIIVACGMIITDFFLYHIGRKYGRRVVAHKRFRKIISARRVRRLEKIFRKWGVLVIFLGRHLVGLRSQIFLVAGILKMPRLKFVLSDAVSSLVTISIMVGAGYWGGNTLEFIKHDMDEAVIALLILVAIACMALLIWRLAVNSLSDDAENVND
jgi:membrane protein DedA with SNARE-associated domain